MHQALASQYQMIITPLSTTTGVSRQLSQFRVNKTCIISSTPTRTICTVRSVRPSSVGYETTDRPIASFHPSPWGDYYLNYTPDIHDEVAQAGKGQTVEELQDAVEEELMRLVKAALATASQLSWVELLNFVDAIERLGVGYRLEEVIEQAMDAIHGMKDGEKNQLDLYHTCTRFRLLRQHGLYVTCDVFGRFQDETGRFKESLASDVKGMLALYEASFVGKHGDYILDEARDFTATHLKSAASSISSSDQPLSSQVAHALYQPLHKGMPRIESRFFINFYEDNPSHNKILLKFAKMDFNLVQALHKKELRDLTRWWKDLNLTKRMPFNIRDRLVESFLWTLGIYYEPKYSLARKISLQLSQTFSVIDDIYDAYGVIEELAIFTEGVERWDRSYMSKLPEYMQICYKVLLDIFEDFEHDLASSGRSEFVKYAREEMQDICRAWMQEAKWRNQKHTLTFTEYMNKASTVTGGSNLLMIVCYLGVNEANKDAFEWAHQDPIFIRDAGIISRLVNDMASHTFERERNHVPSAVENYMTEHKVTEEETLIEFQKQIDYCWKNINEMMMKPHIMPKPLVTIILNQCRAVDVFYKKGEDNYTFSNRTMKDNISFILTDPIPL